MTGTTDEIKQAIAESLYAFYPRGLTSSGISIICFRGKTGADGQSLVGFGDGAELNKALDELVAEGILVSHSVDGYGGGVFHYKTDDRAPVVGLIGEAKLAIEECLCRIYPKELIRVGIELECFKNKYGRDVPNANGLSLAGSVKSGTIQDALDELVADGKIAVHMKELDGAPHAHYAAKPY